MSSKNALYENGIKPLQEMYLLISLPIYVIILSNYFVSMVSEGIF